MIDAGAPSAPTRQIGAGAGSAIAAATAPTPPDLPAPKSHTILWSVLFLIACIVGAAGVTLLPVHGIG